MAIPAGYTQHASGYWFQLSNQSGPYVFDGTTLTLVPLGGVAAAAAGSDTVSNAGPNLTQNANEYIFNGTTWERRRGNVDTAALLTYAAAAAGTNGADQTNYNGRGVKLVVDITALTGVSPTLTVTLQGKDAASGKYYNILVSAALVAVATTVLEVYPGIATAANVTQGVALPRTWRVITAIGGTTPAVTATVGASLIV